MKFEYQGRVITINCSMCGGDAKFIATETNEPLCRNCATINEDIKKSYPHKQKYRTREITKEDIPLILKTLKELEAIN